MARNTEVNTGKHSRFLHIGGDPILDFCNTLVMHRDCTKDHLKSKQELSQFMEETYGGKFNIDSDQFKSLLKFRDLLRVFFKEIAEKQRLSRSLDAMNSWLSDIQFKIEIQNGAKGAHEIVKLVATDPSLRSETTLSFSFYNLLNKMTFERLKKCANPNCSHFFHDTSKSNTRNWCSMKSCGNLMKARAFYNRNKER